ncbi:phosphotransferase family enzyme [Saccharothrix saharensis]|uniref:Phosphotransferase family enzyme n=1 Tax=Saccharothrix saharensis TaxID=571190 RepID=A0A543J8M6_9PSEU|nr:phosphotransferase family enzyme [Saccharothrix saharensis]
MMVVVLVQEVIELVRRERGRELTLVGRFARGDEGAYEVIGADGARLVLKWLSPGREARHAEEHVGPALARLRAAGCPIPPLVAAGRAGGVWFELWEHVAGSPVEHVDGVTLDQLIAVVDRERGAGSGTGGDWWDFVAGGLVEDRSPLCRPSVLVGSERPVSDLLSRLRASAAAARLPERAPDDLVHFDFGPANVLVDEGRVTAVLDWGSCRTGDASYDLVTVDWDLAAWPKAGPGVRERLEDEILRTTDRGALVVYAAHCVLRNLTWASGTEWSEHVVSTGHGFLDRWARA